MNLSSVFHLSNPPNDMILTSVADEAYLKYIYVLVKSLYVSNPTLPIHIRLVDVNGGSHYRQRELLDLNPNVILTFDYSKHNATKNRFPIPNSKWDWTGESRQTFHPKLVSDKMCHCVQVKYKDISNLLDKGYNAIFSIDSDSIIRKDLTSLRNVINCHDITIMDNITEDSIVYDRERAGWKEGAIGIKSTPSSKQFFDKVNEFIDAHGPSHPAGWVVEDKAISSAYEQISIDRGHLPVTFKDEEYGDTFIWSGTGTNKFKNKKYKEEMKKYE